MSRLIDRLKQHSVSQSMGFRTAQPASPKPQMLLIANLTQTENADRLADYVVSADAVVIRISKSDPEAKTLKKIAQSLADIPWGGWLGDIGEKGISIIAEIGCDFLVFPAASSVLAIPRDDKLGKILQVEASLSDSLLRVANGLPVDAVLIVDQPGREHTLTWHQLMLFQRFANLLTKPLLVSIPSNMTGNELKALWEAGVDGVVTEVNTVQPIGKLEELRQAIGDLTSLPPRRRGKVEPLLPYIGGETSTTVPDTE